MPFDLRGFSYSITPKLANGRRIVLVICNHCLSRYYLPHNLEVWSRMRLIAHAHQCPNPRHQREVA